MALPDGSDLRGSGWGYLQATGHTELATWAQNSERTATGPIRQQQWCNCTKTETEPRRGAGRGERAMRAGLKEEDISCCRVVQSQKAAGTRQRNDTRLGSDQSSYNLTDEKPRPKLLSMRVGSEHASGAGLTVIPTVAKNASQTEGAPHRSLLPHRPVSGRIPRETSHFADVGCTTAFSSRGPWVGTQRRRVSTFSPCTVLS